MIPQDVPGDAFGAGRSGQRTGEGEIAALGRKEIRSLDGDGGKELFVVLGGGNILPEGVERGVRGTRLKEHSNDDQVAFGIHVNEMSDERKALTLDFLLGGMVKVKLFERIDIAADGESAADGIIDLNGMAIVDDVERHALVIDFQDGEPGRPGILDVDRRLRAAQRAGRIFRIEVAPLLRIVVGPVRLALLSGAKAERERQAESA